MSDPATVRLTPAQRRMLEFIARGGERGRMLVQVVASRSHTPLSSTGLGMPGLLNITTLSVLRSISCAPRPPGAPSSERSHERGLCRLALRRLRRADHRAVLEMRALRP